ncbi:Ferric siderophore transport system2C periplasmic binding protein TonB [gamma proteobacterium IMCC2047]|nr:Ferric siderophore transport system2C periplasmic binding protein TonB [gamma proteobacterium IMCC2047]
MVDKQPVQPVQQERDNSDKDKVEDKESNPTTLATGVGERLETGGNPAVRQSYLTKVMARIAKFKRYPRSARKDGVTGVVTIKFVIQKNGRVRSSEIVKSSGDARLDEETKNILLRASPFPPVPRELSDRELVLTLPVEFSLNPTRKLF